MKENVELEKEIKKIREDFELEKANLRSNYFLTIFVLIAYILIDKIGNIEIYNILFTKIEIFSGITIILVLFYIRELIKYSQHIVKKYVFKINK